MIVGNTKLYSHIEKVDISFEITNEKIRLYLSMLLLLGTISFQNINVLRDDPLSFCVSKV